MNGRTVIVLMLAIISGLGAMYGVQVIHGKKEAPKPLRDVVVAARGLKVEEILKEELLRIEKRPMDQVPAGAFGSTSELIGRWVQIPMLEGEPIIDPKLGAKDLPPGLIGRIPPGMRAFAIEVNEQSGVSGFIMPGHRVDVIQARDGNSRGTKPGVLAKTILQNVRVLAAGQVTASPDDKSMLVRTVTLAVSPEQVEALVAARSRGSLSLALRALNDDAIVVREEPEPEPRTPPEPLPPPVAVAPPEPPPPPPKPPRRLTVIYHGLVRRHAVDRGPEVGQPDSAALARRGEPAP